MWMLWIRLKKNVAVKSNRSWDDDYVLRSALGEKLGRKKMNQKKTGTAYEKIAADYVRNQGIFILEKNYRISQGEVDLIGETEECIIFFEVKYRKTASYGYPWEAVFRYFTSKNIIHSSVSPIRSTSPCEIL